MNQESRDLIGRLMLYSTQPGPAEHRSAMAKAAELLSAQSESAPIVYQCPQCATEMEVDPSAKPSTKPSTEMVTRAELEKCNDDWNKRYQQWGETEDRLRAELKSLQRFKASVDEALNTGDGTYKP